MGFSCNCQTLLYLLSKFIHTAKSTSFQESTSKKTIKSIHLYVFGNWSRPTNKQGFSKSAFLRSSDSSNPAMIVRTPSLLAIASDGRPFWGYIKFSEPSFTFWRRKTVLLKYDFAASLVLVCSNTFGKFLYGSKTNVLSTSCHVTSRC